MAILEIKRMAKYAKKVIFVSLFLVYSGLILAQGRSPNPPMSLDNIRAEINQIESQDEKLNAYVSMGNRYFRRAPDSLFKLAQEIERLDEVEPEKRTAFSSFILANAWRLMNPDSAIYYANKASELLIDMNENDSYLMMENLLGTQYVQKNEYLAAESLFLGAIKYSKKLQESVQYPIGNFYGNLGNLYVTVGAHDLAITMFEEFLKQADGPANRCNIISKLSLSFQRLGDLDRAISLLSPCIEYEQLPPPIRAIIRSNLSTYYLMRGDSLKSLQLMEEATSISNTYKIPNIANSNLVRLGNRYLETGQIQKADSISALMSDSPLGYSRPPEEIIKDEFLAHLELKKKNNRKSLELADKAIHLANQFGYQEMLRDSYSIKAKAYENEGLLNEALNLERLQNKHDKMLNDQRNDREVAMMSVRYQLKNKEEQLLDASSELRSAKLIYVIIIALLVLTAIYIMYRYRVFYLLKEEKTRNKIAMDLHDDLSGTLSSISFFSEAAQRTQSNPDDFKRFLGMIGKSAFEAKEKINDIIWAIDPSKDDWSVFLKKCKRFTADALDSKEITYEIEVATTFKIPVQLELRQNLWLIFKEMVNNLVEHSKATEATITFVEKGKIIYLEVSDNGIGFDKEREHNRNGVKNILRRAEQIGGEVKVESIPGKGTTWIFKLKT